MYKEKIAENKKIIVVIVFVIYVISFGYLRIYINMWNNYAYNYCKADLILLILNSNYIGTIFSMPMAYLALHITKYDFNLNIILRYKNKHIIWLRQCIHIILNSFIITISVILFDFINGIFYGIETYNWNSYESMFFSRTQKLAINDKLFIVMISVVLISTLIISIVSILCNLIYWITNSQIISCLTTVSFCLWNIFCFNLFNKAKLNEIDFVAGNKFIMDFTILPLILSALIFLSLFLIKKKEFFNDIRR